MAKKKKKAPGHSLYWEAVINQYNLIGLAGMIALSAVLGSPLPFLIALGFELMYVAVIPETEFFKRVVHAKYNEIDEADAMRKHRERLENLHPVQRRRFEEIAVLVESTKSNLDQNESTGLDITSKLDLLRARYLWLMELLNAYEHYLSSIRPGQIETNLSEVDQQIASTESSRVKSTLEERRSVLHKRKARLERVNENHTIVRTQVMTIEDIMRLIHESSMTIQNPADIGRQIDDLLIDVEATEEAVHDLDSFGNISAEDELSAFDKELEHAMEMVEMETRA